MKDDILRIVCDLFPAARNKRPDHDDDLLRSGIVDSVGVLDLVGRLEATFHIVVTDDDLVPDNFRSIASLAAFVRLKQATVVRASS